MRPAFRALGRRCSGRVRDRDRRVGVGVGDGCLHCRVLPQRDACGPPTFYDYHRVPTCVGAVHHGLRHRCGRATALLRAASLVRAARRAALTAVKGDISKEALVPPHQGAGQQAAAVLQGGRVAGAAAGPITGSFDTCGFDAAGPAVCGPLFGPIMKDEAMRGSASDGVHSAKILLQFLLRARKRLALTVCRTTSGCMPAPSGGLDTGRVAAAPATQRPQRRVSEV
jgi:hypothetical protein